MVLGRIDEFEALQIGIQSKMDTYNTYQKALKNIIEKESKELLAILANEVKRQQKRLKEKYSRISGNRLLYLNLSKKMLYYNSISSNANDLDILQIAIEHEKKT